MPNPFSDDSVAKAVEESGVNAQPQQMPTAAQSSLNPSLLKAMLIGTGLDTASTAWSLAKGNKEVNPLMSQNPLVNSLENMGSGIAEALIAKALGHSHPTLAKLIAAQNIGFSGYNTFNNLKTISQMPAGGYPKPVK
jgi:hypothetical protein